MLFHFHLKISLVVELLMEFVKHLKIQQDKEFASAILVKTF